MISNQNKTKLAGMKMKKHKVDICSADTQNSGFMYTYVW